MKYKLDEIITINDKEWRIAEHRMRGGREWIYTLSHEDVGGTYTTMSLNERAIDGITLKGGTVGGVSEV